MEPVTLAAVTTAVATLALDVAKDVATDTAKHAWGKIKGWLGWTKEPAAEDLATDVATKLAANAALAEKIVAELKATDTGAASRVVSKVTFARTNTTGDMSAGRDNFNFQGASIRTGDGAKFGGG